jgi:uncharacterized protein
MRKFLVLVSAVFFSTALHAAVPSEASINELLTVTKIEKMVDNMLPMMDQTMRQSMAAMTKGRPLNPEQQRSLDALMPKMMQIVRDELSWQRMRPLYVQVYQESFTQEEIDGLIAFYKSPAGVAFVNKMPVVMQKSMALMQTRMGPMMEKMNVAMKQAMADAKAGK